MGDLLDRAFHVLILLAFLAAVGTAFVALVAPLLFPDRSGMRIPTLRTALGVALVAAALVAAEWLAHRLF